MAKTTMDLSYQQRPYSKAEHIGGDPGLPFLGSILDLINDPYKLAGKLYQQHGPVARIRLLNQPYLMLMGADINRIICLDEDNNFSPMMGYQQSLGEFYSGGLLVRDFDNHRAHRRIFQTAFKNDTMKLYTDVINREVKNNIDTWQHKTDFHFFPHIKTTLLDIAAQIFLGIADFEREEAAHLADVFENINAGMMSIIRWDTPLLPFCQWRKSKEAMRYMERYLIDQIAERRTTTKMDIFSVICREKDHHGDYFSDQDIASHISFLLFAAHDTTTSNLSYIMQFLAQDQDIQTKARHECQRKGQPFLRFDDLPDMQELEKIQYEALRLRPSATMLSRRTIEQCEIAGVTIPADTIINVFPQFTHMMAEYWDEPEKFDPERFSPERAEHKRHPYQFLPFGGGAHKCIGMHFSGMIVKCFMNQMLLNYEWHVADGYDPKHQVLPMPRQKDGLPLILSRRGHATDTQPWQACAQDRMRQPPH